MVFLRFPEAPDALMKKIRLTALQSKVLWVLEEAREETIETIQVTLRVQCATVRVATRLWNRLAATPGDPTKQADSDGGEPPTLFGATLGSSLRLSFWDATGHPTWHNEPT